MAPAQNHSWPVTLEHGDLVLRPFRALRLRESFVGAPVANRGRPETAELALPLIQAQGQGPPLRVGELGALAALATLAALTIASPQARTIRCYAAPPRRTVQKDRSSAVY